MTYKYEAALFAERNRNQAFDAVIRALEQESENGKLTRKQIAQKIGRSPPQITNWLSGPSNWTLDTLSDLLFAVDATMEYNVVFNRDRKRSNRYTVPEEPAESDVMVNVNPSASTSKNVLIVVPGNLSLAGNP